MGWFALGWIALTPLLWALDGLDRRARWRLGYGCGLCSYALINWWIIPTVAKGTPTIGLPPVIGVALGLLAVLLIGLIHGSLVALVALTWDTRGRLAQRAPWALPIIIAVLWAALDAARSETQLAHGWGALAYTQWRDTALLQSAALIGQHGLTALCVWVAASLALWMRRGDAILWRAPVLVFAALHGWGAWRLATAPLARSTLRVLLVQTNVSSLGKNSDVPGELPLAQAWRLTQEGAAHGPFDVIVWPETSVSVWHGADGRTQRDVQHGGAMRAIDALCRETRASLLFGANSWTGPAQVSNNAMLVTPQGAEFSNAKQRLVPFGERASYSEYLPFLSRLAPDPPVTPDGPVHVLPLPLRPDRGRAACIINIGSIVCFESCFRYPARTLGQAGAQALFVLTNDEWFAGTNSPWEHAAMATVRAVENGVPVVQAANAGYSFAVDRYGRFVADTSGPDALSTYGEAQAIAVDVPLP